MNEETQKENSQSEKDTPQDSTSKFNPIPLVLIFALLTLIFASSQLNDCQINFVDLKSIGAIVLGYTVIAAILEQFIENIFLKSEIDEFKKAINKRDAEKMSFQYMNQNSFNKSALDSKEAQIVSLEDKIDQANRVVNKKLNIYSFSFGIVIASLGFNFINEITNPVDINCYKYYEEIYTGLGIFLSAILIASGSSFVRGIIVRT